MNYKSAGKAQNHYIKYKKKEKKGHRNLLKHLLSESILLNKPNAEKSMDIFIM